ncbi:hypothetical protein CAPTEDRAFT_207774 [Capitella teleta]|uniref:Uncharacterized protein n=1 Tax=Capitella teleta TaxID=283909 RepID=R7TWY0_CAPTE|nr:hypothetical protein CAPTEDRAFT_207774 [Capitella teleta]|eukprot:ELT98112.1 hypothetical protein CAPTEDRAFT_207774 [Capitella teleta]
MFKAADQSDACCDLLVDCGATLHIVRDEAVFTKFDDNFNPGEHYIELAKGSRRISNQGLCKMATNADSAIWFQLKVVREQSTENRVVKAAPGTSVKNLLAHELHECTIPRVTGKTKAGSEETDLRQDMPVDMVKEFGFLFLHAYVHELDEAKAEPTPPSGRPSTLQLLLDMSKF